MLDQVKKRAILVGGSLAALAASAGASLAQTTSNTTGSTAYDFSTVDLSGITTANNQLMAIGIPVLVGIGVSLVGWRIVKRVSRGAG